MTDKRWLTCVTLIACAAQGPPTGVTETPSGDIKPLRFIAVGDTGKGVGSDQAAVADAMTAWCALHGCDFLVFLGDNIYENGVVSADDAQWQDKFEMPYAALDIPVWAVLGNHDYGPFGMDRTRGFHQVAYAMKPGQNKWFMPDRHYHVNPGTQPGQSELLELFALDTNEAHVSRHADPRGFDDAAQRTAFAGWIPASTAHWKVALGHHPYLSNGPHGNAGSYDGTTTQGPNGVGVKSLLDDLVCGRVDLYLAGHDHSLQWLEGTCAGTELALSGAGSVTSSLRDPLDSTHNPARYEHLAPGFLFVEVTAASLTATFVDLHGNLLFSRTLSH